ncbi:hypothetical protein [Mesorhizobium humile]|uniref:Uncharacterized protein n=1 Tax=Mesorhizobium humile TaxID=3072313 RepID=A0ABU4YLZ9_9HYPH|nr:MULTISPECIES: hypothetical protein [unclassified Mesorhizobium]MDX8457912.1 hypothetical protein [Mesorhizobium sp. VK2D]MDX8487992.1 hypothetical protein [Mesorhizobium sp. VK2B]
MADAQPKRWSGIIGAGAIVVVLGTAWSDVSPIVAWANTDGISWSVFAFRVLGFLISIGALISVGTVFAQATANRARQHQFLADFETVTEKLESFSKGMDKAIGVQEETMGIFAESVAILDNLKAKKEAQTLRETIKKSKANRDQMRRMSDQAREMAADLIGGNPVKR